MFLQGVCVGECGEEPVSVRLVLSGSHAYFTCAAVLFLRHLLGCHSGGQCRQYQRQHSSCWAFSGDQVVLSQLVLSSSGYRCGLSAQQIRFSRLLWHERLPWFADGWTVGAYVHVCTVAGLAVSYSLDNSTESAVRLGVPFPWTKVWWIEGSQVATGLVSTAPANLHVPRLSGGFFWVSQRCSVLSRVRVRGSSWTFSVSQAVDRCWYRLRVVTRGSLLSYTPFHWHVRLLCVRSGLD